MATAVSATHLALTCLSFLHLLAGASSHERYFTTSSGTDTAAATLPLLASVLPLASDAPPNAEGWPAFSNTSGPPASASSPPEATPPTRLPVPVYASSHAADTSDDLVISAATGSGLSPHVLALPVVRERVTASSTTTGQPLGGPVFSDHLRRSTHSPSTNSGGGDISERRLVARQQGPYTAASPGAAPPCPRAASVPAAPRGATGMTKTLLGALPLLAIPFLPPPVAAVVVLSSLAAPAEGWFGSECSKLAHPTCAVYHYDNETGLLNRRRPDPSLNAICDHPLCYPTYYERVALQAQQHGREDDPLMIYCVVRDLIYPATITPWLNEWETHMPIDNPAAAAASGASVCYVELTHMSYREGYYIRCPNPYKDGRHSSCTRFVDAVKEEDEKIAAVVWEYRRLHYRDNVWPRYGTRDQSTEKQHDEL